MTSDQKPFVALKLGSRDIVPIRHQHKHIREMLFGGRPLLLPSIRHISRHGNNHHDPRVLRPLHQFRVCSSLDLRGSSKPVILVDDVHVEPFDFVLDFALLLGKWDKTLLFQEGIPFFWGRDDGAVDADVGGRVRGGEILGVGVDVAGEDRFAVG